MDFVNCMSTAVHDVHLKRFAISNLQWHLRSFEFDMLYYFLIVACIIYAFLPLRFDSLWPWKLLQFRQYS